MTELLELFEAIRRLGQWGWLIIPSLLIVFGALPTTTLRLIVRMFPDGHDRREQLLGDLYDVPFASKWLFVAQSLEIAISEGLTARIRNAWNARRSRRRRPPLLIGWTLKGRDAHALFVSHPDAFDSTAKVCGPTLYLRGEHAVAELKAPALRSLAKMGHETVDVVVGYPPGRNPARPPRGLT